MTKRQLREKIEALERRVAELEARPQQGQWIWPGGGYANPQWIAPQPQYVPNTFPQSPTITPFWPNCGPIITCRVPRIMA